LATCEREKATGKDFLTAVVLGYDVECRVGVALNTYLTCPERSFHPSAVCGCFGAAVAAGKILSLDEDQMVQALGLAGQQASGLLSGLNERGHMALPLQLGFAARNGVTAALLVKEGFAGPPDIFDGKWNIFDAFSGGHASEKLTEDLGRRFEVLRTSLKPYACCAALQSPIQALLGIIRKWNLNPDSIAEINVKLAPTLASIVDGVSLITHDIKYVMSAAAYDGEFSVKHHSEKKRNDPRVQTLAEKVRVIGDPELQPLYPHHYSAIVKVRTKEGKILEERVRDFHGVPEDPMTHDEVVKKFTSLATMVMDIERVKKLIKAVDNLEDVGKIQNITKILSVRI
jgi:2-methylcitrate dehydratase PrpD